LADVFKVCCKSHRQKLTTKAQRHKISFLVSSCLGGLTVA
jgi:hypothetical protein